MFANLDAGTLAEAFRAVAREHAQRPAILDGERTLTYAELDEATDRLCESLRSSGARNDPIEVVSHHDADTICALLAALKCGRAFVPVDPDWPEDYREAVRREAAAIPESARGTLALLTFTSGSTGRPRTIATPHEALLEAARGHISGMRLGAGDRVGWLAPLTAGAANMPIFGALLSGACLCPFSVKTRGLSEMRAWAEREKITVLMMVSTLFRQFPLSLEPGANLPALRLLKLGGEPVLRKDVELFRERFHSGVTLMNGLGVTECGGNVSLYSWARTAHCETATLPVGRAVNGVDLLVVDADGKPVEPGASGEIVVRAPRRMAKYANDPEANRIRFAPLSDQPDAPTFHTGDLGRFLPSGDLLHLGRIDERLKIRGQAVVPAEVEAVLRDLDGVHDAAVVGRERTGSMELAAFVVLADGRTGALPELREALRRRLPPFMIPTHIAGVVELPLLPGGKIDRVALAKREAAPPPAAIVRPRDALEALLARIWEVVLGRPAVGVTANFFQLGGDLNSAARLLALMDSRLLVRLPPDAVERYPTVEAMAALLRSKPDGVWRMAVLMEPGQNERPLFLVPGSGLDVNCFSELARRMGPELPVYAMRFPGLDGAPFRHDSVETLARLFLAEIKKIQPRGPYRLAGLSMGGFVAHEMACQLQDAGESVEFLGLFDTKGHGYERFRPRALIRHLPLIVLRWFLPETEKHILTWANFREGCDQKWTRAVARMKLWFRSSATARTVRQRRLSVQAVNIVARLGPRPRIFKGRMDLFRAAEQPPDFLYDLSPDMNWKAFVSGELAIHDVPGAHVSHIREPNAPVVAALIKKRLCGTATVGEAPYGYEEIIPPRDALEIQLVRLWETVLEREPIGVRDNFFQIGGDSLGAMRLFALMDQRLQVNLPPDSLVTHPTIEALAGLIREDHRDGLWATAALLSNGADSRPIYLVPGAGVDVIQFIDLARRLGPELTVYAMRFPGLDGSPFRHRSIAELAELFLAAVKRIQPHGPFRLGGVSMGGLVAYEMACQLTDAGEEVEFVGLFDAMGPGYLKFRPWALVRHLPLILVRWVLPNNQRHILTWANFCEGAYRRWNRGVARMKLWFRKEATARTLEQRRDSIKAMAYAASARFRPRPYLGRVDLFRAEVQPPDFLYDLAPDLNWGRFVRGALVIHDVPGDHAFHIHEPHAPVLADKIKTRLREAAKSSNAVESAAHVRSREIWEELAGWWDARVGDEGRRDSRDALAPVMDRLLDIRAGERAVDAACGNGWYARRMARAGARVTAFDFSATFIERAKEHPHEGRPIEWRVLDAASSADMDALPEGQFDAVACAMAIMDMSQVDLFFAGVGRWLNAGGRFVFSMIDPDSPAFARMKTGETLIHIGPGGQSMGHPYFHRKWGDLVEMLECAGLTSESSETISIPDLGQFRVARFFKRLS